MRRCDASGDEVCFRSLTTSSSCVYQTVENVDNRRDEISEEHTTRRCSSSLVLDKTILAIFLDV